MISVVIAMLISTMSVAQTYSFDEFALSFQKKQIKMPINYEDLLKMDLSLCPQIDCELYNYIVIKIKMNEQKGKQ